MWMQMLLGGRLNAENITLRVLILVAYDLRGFQISGSPAWINSDRYDLNAKFEGNPTFERLGPMLQSLLADRFKLAFHQKTKEASVYELTAAKGRSQNRAIEGRELHDTRSENPPPPPSPGEKPPIYCDNLRIGKSRIDSYGILMLRLLNVISDLLGHTIIDKTGFSATFEFAPMKPRSAAFLDKVEGHRLPTQPHLRSSPRYGSNSAPDRNPVRVRIEVLVIDHVERLSQN
jgi:uncharacterized protein (TIGR03435 family)